MLEFRYRVNNCSRAAAILGGRVRSYLFKDTGNSRLIVPAFARNTISARRAIHLQKAGSINFLIFPNPGRNIEAGDRITIVAGKLRAENLEVLA